jgi:site-specific DNA-cytosine methylase
MVFTVGSLFSGIGGFETSWKKVPTIIEKSENEFLDKLIPKLFIKEE